MADARKSQDTLIIARTDVIEEAEAIERGKAYVKAGADVIQPISKCFSSIEGLRAMRQGCGVPLSLQILGWLEKDLSPKAIEEVAGIATFALVPLMTVAAALRENLKVLAEKRSAKDLPRPVTNHADFIDFIGFTEVEELQLKYLRAS